MKLDYKYTIGAGGSRTFKHCMQNIGVYGISQDFSEREVCLSDIDFNQKFKAVLKVELTGEPVQVDHDMRSMFSASVTIELNPAMFAVEGDTYLLR